MKVSAFTPTHDPQFLPEVWACLQEQTYKNWEWVVVANGPKADKIVQEVRRMTNEAANVKLFRQDSRPIGFLKRFACDQSTGDLLLELDHDDQITEDCFASVVQTAQTSPREAFIYSDAVTYDVNKDCCVLYSSYYGWEHYNWKYRGKEYQVNKQPEIHPRALSEILFCPDHVRVWTRAAYAVTGGHNQYLEVADDHELMIRTYLAGVAFVKTPTPLYFHRLRGDNTSQTKVNQIQRYSIDFKNRYLHALVQEWCRREKLPMYDLGGYHNCPKGYIPIDKDERVLQHPEGICCDVLRRFCQRDGQPMRPYSVGCFRAFDFLEHIPSTKIPKLLNRIYDLLVPGGFLLTATPSVCGPDGKIGRGAFQDPTHVSFWSENNWWYYTKADFAKYVPEIRCRFQAVRLLTYYPSEWHEKNGIPYVVADLCAIKPERRIAGLCEI